MNKNQRPSKNGRKQAAIGLVVCFVAAIAITGAYTWTNYKDRTERELAQAEEERQAKEEAVRQQSEATGGTAKKAQEEAEETLPEEMTQEQTEEEGAAENAEATAGSAGQLYFGEESQLLWPVNGNVVMSFSMDKTVYFSTLDQYKYNPALIISGALNDNVIAAAPGIVKSIEVLPQTGTTVTVDMGNGYECLYGQLKEVPVKVGDYVNASQVIGYLSEPTKYYSIEGCNLYFEMHKDGQPVNPVDYMAE